MTISRFQAAACLILLLAMVGTVAAAPNKVTYSNGIDPAIEVSDGDTDDDDLDADEIRVEFSLVDPFGDWIADGVILATTTDPGGATLVVTETTIQNVSGDQVIGAIIEINHHFDPLVSFTQQYEAAIDGTFDKIGGGVLGNFILDNFTLLNGAVPVDQFNFVGGLDDAPQTFADGPGLPVHLDTVIRQTETFIFYIDELDNTINLHDSATLLPTSASVPVMGRTAMVVLGMGLMALLVFAIGRRYAAQERD